MATLEARVQYAAQALTELMDCLGMFDAEDHAHLPQEFQTLIEAFEVISKLNRELDPAEL